MKLSDRVHDLCEHTNWQDFEYCEFCNNVKPEMLRLAEDVERNARNAYKYGVRNSTGIRCLSRARQAKLHLLRLAVEHGVAEEMGLL